MGGIPIRSAPCANLGESGANFRLWCMTPLFVFPVLLLGFLASILGALAVGRGLGMRDKAVDLVGVGAVDGAVFALLGLLIAFTFSGGAERFERRRGLAIQEANAMGTAYLRLDLLPPPTQPRLRETFRRYVDARIATYRAIPDMSAVHQADQRARALQGEIWTQAVSACQASPGWRPDPLVLPALNEMIDLTTTRAAAAQTHPPIIIYLMLAALALVAALLAGYGMTGSARANRFHAVAFALVLMCTVYVILEMEFPRWGLVRIDAVDQLLVDVRNTLL